MAARRTPKTRPTRAQLETQIADLRGTLATARTDTRSQIERTRLANGETEAARNLASDVVRDTRQSITDLEDAAGGYRLALERLVRAFESVEGDENPGGLLSLGATIERARRVLHDIAPPLVTMGAQAQEPRRA